MSRLKPIHPDDMTDSAQRAYYDKIMNRENFKNLPSGTPLSGPFHAYQRSPNFASKMLPPCDVLCTRCGRRSAPPSPPPSSLHTSSLQSSEPLISSVPARFHAIVFTADEG